MNNVQITDDSENLAIKNNSSLIVARTVLGNPQWCSLGKIICTDIFGKFRRFDSLKNLTQIDEPPKKLFDSKVNVNDSILSYLDRRRFASESLGPSYLSINDPDYKPVAFLERAFRLSASVCRITQSMPFRSLIPLIKNWSPQNVPAMCKALEAFFKSPPRGSSWDEYWKAKTFEAAFKSNDLDGKACENNQQALFVPYATGFLVGKNHILTNFHVLNAFKHEKNLDDFRVQFRYERNLNNRDLRPIEYKLKSILSGDSELDYTLLEIESFPEMELDISQKVLLTGDDIRRAKLRKAKLSFEQAGENFGWLRMNSVQPVIPSISPTQIEEAENQLRQGKLNPDEKKLLEESKLRGGIQGEPIIIIQHPRGRAKEIVTFNSHVLEASESYIQYTTDTDLGASGSPILNGDLQLIGLHFGALIEYNLGNPKEINDNQVESKSKDYKSSISIKANIGTRISAIVKHLRTAANSYEKIKQVKKDWADEKGWTDEFTEKYSDGQKENESIGGQKVGEFIREYIDDQCKVPRRIFLLGGLERNISGDAAFTQKLVEEMSKKLDKMRRASQPPERSTEKYNRVKIINALGDIKLFSGELNGSDKKRDSQRIPFSKLRILSDPQLHLKIAIAWINIVCEMGDGGDENERRTYLPGDVALQLVTEKYESEELQLKLKQLKRKSLSEQESDPLPRGTLVYHVSDNRERRSHAELILDTISEGIPTLRSRGVLSDFVSAEGRLTFCRDLYMPSLVVSLGFLENPLDQQVLGANEEKIFDEDKLKKLAGELIEAVIDWSEALNPGSFSPNKIAK